MIGSVFWSFAAKMKYPSMELTIRTPYWVVCERVTDFIRVVAKTDEGVLIVNNKMPPAMHILPPGPLIIRLSNSTNEFSGDFIHSGGWLIIHGDNSCEINLMDCFEKKEIWGDLISQKDFDLGLDNIYIGKIQTRAYNSFIKAVSA